MPGKHDAQWEELARAVLETPGDLATEIRQAIEARSAAHGGRPGEPAGEVPGDLVAYVDKVAKHAYKVTDEDVEALKEVGYSEDAIFEATLAAALGAAMARRERGLAALRGEA